MSALKRIPKDTFVRDASHKRRGNIDVSDPAPPAVVRTRDRKRNTARDIETEPPSLPVETIAASAKQIAAAGGANLPVFREGMGSVDQSSYGSVGGVGILLDNGNIVYAGGQTIIKNQATVEEVRAVFLHSEQTVAEARTRLATAIVDRNNYQRAVDSKMKAWNRAIEHCDTAYAHVQALKAQQVEAQNEAINNTVSTGLIAIPRSAAIALELVAANQAFEVATQARGTVLTALQEKKTVLARAETEVKGNAMEVLIAESRLLAITARETVLAAQQALTDLHALDTLSHSFGNASTRPQTISQEAVEVIRTHMPTAQHTAEQVEMWTDYINRLTQNADATMENQQ